VAVSARRGDGRVEVAVADTGLGIAPEEQGRVFEEFGQARSAAGQSEGSGWGWRCASASSSCTAGRSPSHPS
jgi:signal transduction histidine kinase